jgi:hypothetical protein
MITSPLTEARRWVLDRLDGLDVPVFGWQPDVVPLPCVVVTPARPWLAASTYGQVTVSLTITVWAPLLGTPESQTERVETLVADVVDRVGWAAMPQVDQPVLQQAGQATGVATDIVVAITVTPTRKGE